MLLTSVVPLNDSGAAIFEALWEMDDAYRAPLLDRLAALWELPADDGESWLATQAALVSIHTLFPRRAADDSTLSDLVLELAALGRLETPADLVRFNAYLATWTEANAFSFLNTASAERKAVFYLYSGLSHLLYAFSWELTASPMPRAERRNFN